MHAYIADYKTTLFGRVSMDLITLDVQGRILNLQVDETELARRRVDWTPHRTIPERGYVSMYAQHVTQANKGCDFDYLQAGAVIEEPEIF